MVELSAVLLTFNIDQAGLVDQAGFVQWLLGAGWEPWITFQTGGASDGDGGAHGEDRPPGGLRPGAPQGIQKLHMSHLGQCVPPVPR